MDALVFNDVLRQAGRHGLLDQSGVERWLAYRANRNNTAHDYGQDFANHTLTLLPDYLQDVRQLAGHLQKVFDAKVTQQNQEGFAPISLDLAPRHLQLVLNLLCQHAARRGVGVWQPGKRRCGNAAIWIWSCACLARWINPSRAPQR